MIRFLLRMAGFLILAAAFATLVVDGARSLAADRVLLFSFADQLAWVEGGRYAALMQEIARLPAAAQPILRGVLAVPGSVVLGVAGLLLLLAGRPPMAKIGFSSR